MMKNVFGSNAIGVWLKVNLPLHNKYPLQKRIEFVHSSNRNPFMKSMKNITGKLLVLTAFLLGFLVQATAKQYLILAHNGESALASYHVDPKTGKLKKHSMIELTGSGGPFSVTRDDKLLYVQGHLKKPNSKKNLPHVFTITLSKGKMKQVHAAEINDRAPSIHIDTSGKLLLGAHYGPGKVSVWEVDEKGWCTGKLLQEIETAPRAHFITTDPSNRFAYVPHTSPNAIFQFALDLKAKKLNPLNPPSVKGPDPDHRYHEPRHYAPHPTLSMGYSSNEKGGGISAWNFDVKTGRLNMAQTLSALPKGYDGNGAAADIHLTPNGKFAYVSNRDYTAPRNDPNLKRKDSIAAFRIHPKTGLLARVGTYPTEHAPRSFCIDRSGHYLYAAGQHVNKLAAFRIDQETGALTRLATYPTGKVPIWVSCVED